MGFSTGYSALLSTVALSSLRGTVSRTAPCRRGPYPGGRGAPLRGYPDRAVLYSLGHIHTDAEDLM